MFLIWRGSFVTDDADTSVVDRAQSLLSLMRGDVPLRPSRLHSVSPPRVRGLDREIEKQRLHEEVRVSPPLFLRHVLLRVIPFHTN